MPDSPRSQAAGGVAVTVDNRIHGWGTLMPEGNGQVVCVDLDGVLADYHGWKGSAQIGALLSGAREFLAALAERGYYVVILTARQDHDAVRAWLDSHELAYRRVTSTKVPAIAYIDDRALRFDGSWFDMARQIGRKPWWSYRADDDGNAADWRAFTEALEA